MKPFFLSQDDHSLKRTIYLFSLLIVFLIFLIGLSLGRLPPEIPLFYSRPWGEDQIGPQLFLFLIPSVALLLFFLTLVVTKTIEKKDLFVLRLLWGGGAFATVLGTITLGRILLLLW